MPTSWIIHATAKKGGKKKAQITKKTLEKNLGGKLTQIKLVSEQKKHAEF